MKGSGITTGDVLAAAIFIIWIICAIEMLPVAMEEETSEGRLTVEAVRGVAQHNLETEKTIGSLSF